MPTRPAGGHRRPCAPRRTGRGPARSGETIGKVSVKTSGKHFHRQQTPTPIHLPTRPRRHRSRSPPRRHYVLRLGPPSSSSRRGAWPADQKPGQRRARLRIIKVETGPTALSTNRPRTTASKPSADLHVVLPHLAPAPSGHQCHKRRTPTTAGQPPSPAHAPNHADTKAPPNREPFAIRLRSFLACRPHLRT